jgi:hypothetical protein
MALHPAVVMISAWLYSRYYEGPGKLEDVHTFASLGGLVGLWAVSLVFVVLLTPHDQRYTFVARESGSEYCKRRFQQSAGNDEMRSDIFNVNEYLWASIRAEVSDWVRKNCNTWRASRPAWFTAALIARIPADFLPPLPPELQGWSATDDVRLDMPKHSTTSLAHTSTATNDPDSVSSAVRAPVALALGGPPAATDYIILPVAHKPTDAAPIAASSAATVRAGLPRDIDSWTCLHVHRFLTSFGHERFVHAAEICSENLVDGKTFLTLSAIDFEELLDLTALQALRLMADLAALPTAAGVPAAAPADIRAPSVRTTWCD